MSFLKRHVAVVGVAVSCLGVGAAASAIATAGAASPSPSPSSAHVLRHRRWARIPGVHAELVVHTRSGFQTITADRGFVDSVSGETLTLREGTRTATYKTVTLTIPAGARVRNNGKRAPLSSVSAGEHVLVVRGPARTWVIARTPAGR